MKRAALITASLVFFAHQACAGEIPVSRQAELMNLLKQDCGSCHGLSMKGGLGPALTPELLQDKPADFLALTILYGRGGTPMPPWRQFLSDGEALWLAERIKEGVQ